MKKPNFHIEIKSVGTLDISTEMLIADPCYCGDIAGQFSTGSYLQPDMKTGHWDISARILRQRSSRKVISITLKHEDYDKITAEGKGTKISLGFVNVDSGQLVIASKTDIVNYYQQKICDEDYEDEFYDECCDATISLPAKILTDSVFGVVTNTGYGDGTYEATAIKNGDEVIWLHVSFIENYD